MNKQTIIRYFNKKLTDREVSVLFRWIEASEDNRRYFNIVKNLWTASSLNVELDTEPDFNDLKKRIAFISQKSKSRTVFMRYIVRAAAILVLPLAVSVLWLINERNSHTLLVQNDNPIVRIYTPLCTKAEVTLPDGTHVWLNSGTSLTYPRLFEGKERQVKLEGEAYFDVAENKSYPFVVLIPHKLTINVTGTSFNVRAYAEDEDAEMTLIDGTINLHPEGSKQICMEPKQSVRCLRAGNVVHLKSDVDTDLYTSWKDGILSFEDVSMTDLAKRLERWYGVNIHIDDRRVLKHRYSGRFQEESIKQVLELIKQTSNIGYRIEEKEVFLFTEKQHP